MIENFLSYFKKKNKISLIKLFSTLSRRQRVIIRNRAERLSELLDWKTLGGVIFFLFYNLNRNFFKLYRESRRLALKRVHPDLEIKISDIIAQMPRPLSAASTPSMLFY